MCRHCADFVTHGRDTDTREREPGTRGPRTGGGSAAPTARTKRSPASDPRDGDSCCAKRTTSRSVPI